VLVTTAWVTEFSASPTMIAQIIPMAIAPTDTA
jgi:hypothetical protein